MQMWRVSVAIIRALCVRHEKIFFLIAFPVTLSNFHNTINLLACYISYKFQGVVAKTN